MNAMVKLKFLVICILVMSTLPIMESVAASKQKPASQPESAGASQSINDFPTQARVEYVSQCMAEHGGTNLDNMYHCVCAVDKIAGLMRYEEYSESLTFTYMLDTPGDKGGEFRDPPKSKLLRDKLKNAQKEAAVCFPTLPQKSETPPKP